MHLSSHRPHEPQPHWKSPVYTGQTHLFLEKPPDVAYQDVLNKSKSMCVCVCVGGGVKYLIMTRSNLVIL